MMERCNHGEDCRCTVVGAAFVGGRVMDVETRARDDYAAQWQAESTLRRTDLDWVSWLVERLAEAERRLELIAELPAVFDASGPYDYEHDPIARGMRDAYNSAAQMAGLAPSKEGECARCGFVGTGSEGFGTHRCKEATL